ncbi:MAG: HNH endonuclease [Actinobacteria bacterium HGW-Actinobacteria-2]|nr:MAG: HNH endonuclease [Actinobacteria bacterium HGW-Actinobacteria-2]
MEEHVQLAAGDALAAMVGLFDRIDSARAGVDAATRLEWVRLARTVHQRAGALAAVLTGEAERAQASERVTGTPMASWLSRGETLSRREASGAVAQAKALTAHPEVGQAAVDGRLGAGQVRSITRVLDGLAAQLDATQQVAAEQVLIGLAGHLDAEQLARSAGTVLAQVVPATANELLETRLQREHEAAWRDRSLRFHFEGASVRFDGSLPRLEAESWLAQLDAHAEAARRTRLNSREAATEFATQEQRRADAFIAMLGACEKAKPVTGVGGATVIVKLDYKQLLADAAGAGAVGEGHQLSAGELRRVCCDAELIPMVLGSASEVLDVGRAHRLVTPPIRTALIVRDEGCAFPGCGVRPSLCEAHHIVPWWADGETSLSNLVLLCHTHHGLVEPAKFGLRDQWQVEIAGDGLPQFIPPRRSGPDRRPLRRQRGAPVVASASAAG